MAANWKGLVNTRRKVTLFVVTALLGTVGTAWGKTPVLLSTDVGNEIDDQWAITYLLTNPDFDVQGIVSAHAPSLPDPAAHSTYEVLVDVVERRLGMATHPPLLEGSSLPLADNKTARPSDGLNFIIETAKRYSKENRLTVLTIGAATDVASAILSDPTMADRINVVAMGFKDLSRDGGKEYNVQNDPRAWQVILDSHVPVVIGSADVCRAHLSLSYERAATLVGSHGVVGAWLWAEYKRWYFRNVKPLRVNDFSKPWVIWDIITLAYVEGMTERKSIGRPVLGTNLSFEPGKGPAKAIWITSVDSERLWKDFLEKLDDYQRSHAIQPLPFTP